MDKDPHFEAALAACRDPQDRVELLYRRLAGHVKMTHMGRVEPKHVTDLLTWARNKAAVMTDLADRLEAAAKQAGRT